MYQGPVHQSHGNHPHRDHLVGAVEGEYEEVLLRTVGVVAQEGESVRRMAYPIVPRGKHPSGELESRGELARLCGTHTRNKEEPLRIGAVLLFFQRA